MTITRRYGKRGKRGRIGKNEVENEESSLSGVVVSNLWRSSIRNRNKLHYRWNKSGDQSLKAEIKIGYILQQNSRLLVFGLLERLTLNRYY